MDNCTQCGWPFHDYPFRTCRSCRVVHIIDINALDENADVQFDRDRDLDERGLVGRDARNEENPRQSQGGREY